MIAIAGSYAALDLAGRVITASGRARARWLAGGAVAMGIAIWEVHFKGLLAFRLPVSVAYHWPTALASFMVAVFASAVALHLVSRQKMGPVQVGAGSLILGGGIAALHYINMAAMRVAAVCQFDLRIVILSIVLAIIFSLVALTLASGLREETRDTHWRRIASVIVMGTAISAMHYTGMASATFVLSPLVPDLSHAVNISPLANAGVAMITLLLLGAAIVTSSADRQAKRETRRINEALEERVATRTLQLDAVNQVLRKEIVERERAEEAVRNSEDRLRLVIDTIPQQIWSGPPDGSLDFCNMQWRSYMGFTQEELQGEGWQRMLHPDDRERVLNAWRESVGNGTPYEQEERHRGADGQYRWFLARGVPLRDSRGCVVRWFGTNTDIQDRREAEDRLRLVVDTTPAMLQSGRPDGYLDFFNQRWLEYVGLSSDDMCGWRWTRVIHPDDVEEEVGKWRTALATGEPFEAQVRVRRADGEYRWMLHRKVPARDNQGTIIKWYGSYVDIEDRKRAEDELRRQKEVFQTIFENIPVMIGFMGEDGRFKLVNPGWERTLGWTLQEIHEQNVDIFAELFPDPQYLQKVLDVIAASTGEFKDLKVRVRDGRVIDLSVAVVHLSDGTSVAIGREITERKRAEAALQQAQDKLAHVTRVVAMGELAATIAHEVNQPLTAIVTNANFCLRQFANGTGNPDKLREAISDIVNDATRASAVISRIRELLRKGVPQRAELDINQTIGEVTMLLRDELTRNRVSFYTDLAPDLPRVFGDRVQLQQVLINLVMNGIEAMRSITGRPRELLIQSAKIHDEVSIQVQDSGTGLDPEQVEHVFEPFFTTKPEGIGMGLSVSRSIVESHGGRLWAESGPGGALFQFTLPSQ
ncbi:MAG: PAS domain S-box protein [Candidatus Sulfotelmatobacter sp.]